MEKSLITTALLALSACGPSDAPMGTSIDWRCDDGASFSVRVTTSGDAEILAGGQVYHLPGAVAGSGRRYTNGLVEYWERGDEAMLNGANGAPYNNCRRG